jgi:hypothetical protein
MLTQVERKAREIIDAAGLPKALAGRSIRTIRGTPALRADA